MGFAFFGGMSRSLRRIDPKYGDLVEITTRTQQGRYLIKPSKKFNRIVLGVLGRALNRNPGVSVVAFAFMSNHYIMLLRVLSAQHLSNFMEYFNGNLARRAAKFHDWSDHVWSRRYTLIQVIDEAMALDRLRYVLAHGVKEGLVRRLRHWPGVSCLEALLHGTALQGVWIDQSAESDARRCGRKVDEEAFATTYPIPLVPLPCWEHLTDKERQARVLKIVLNIERDAELKNLAEGRIPIGPRRILAQNPHDRPAEFKKSPAPSVHASSKATRKAFMESMRQWRQVYRAAADLVKEGRAEEAHFPPGCFPPGLPFVPDPEQIAAAPS